MVAPRIDEKRFPVAGTPGKSPLCVPDMTHSITAHCLVANRLVTPYLKSGAAAKALFTKPRKFLLSPSDQAEGNVLENTVVGEKGQNPFRIVILGG